MDLFQRLAVVVGAIAVLAGAGPGLTASTQAAELAYLARPVLQLTPTAPGEAWCRPDTILVTLTPGDAVHPLVARYGGTWTLIVPTRTFSVTVGRSDLVTTLRRLRAEPTVESAELDA